MPVPRSRQLSADLALGTLVAVLQALIWLRTGLHPASSAGDELWPSESAFYLLHEGALRRPMHDDALGSATLDYLAPISSLVQAAFFRILDVNQFSMLAQSSFWCTLVSALVYVTVRLRGGSRANAFLASIAIYGSQIAIEALFRLRYESIQFFFFLAFMACDSLERRSRSSGDTGFGYRFAEGLSIGVACLAYYPMAPFVLIAAFLTYDRAKLRVDRNLIATMTGGALVGGLFLVYVAQCGDCFFRQVLLTGASRYIALENIRHFAEVLRSFGDGLRTLELLILFGICLFCLGRPMARKFGIKLAVLIVPVFIYARPSQAALAIILCVVELGAGRLLGRNLISGIAMGTATLIGAAKITLAAATAHIQRDGRDYAVIQQALAHLPIAPNDVIATTGQAWLALRPRVGRDQLHHLLHATIRQSFVSSSRMLFDDKLETRLRYVIVLDGTLQPMRESYPVLDRMFATGQFRHAFEVNPPFKSLPWALTSPYHIHVYERVQP